MANLNLFLGTSMLLKKLVTGAALAAAIACGGAIAATPASAAPAQPNIGTQRCELNRFPTSIEFYLANSNDVLCFGGTIGTYGGPPFQAFTMHAGGYYGYFTVTDGKDCRVVYFTPGKVIGFGPGTVTGVTISPRPPGK
jgi:hypothetical protein